MNEIKVNKQDLLSILKTNRGSHMDIFLEAQKNYRTLVIQELDKMLQSARENKKIITTVNLIAPVDMTKEYDLVIEMLEMGKEDTVTITNQQFRNYVKDDWSWKRQFLASNVQYSAEASAMYDSLYDE